jgi:hypothetical protein
MSSRELYHGTNGDNILSIIRTGLIEPGADNTIFFSLWSWESVLMYGADRAREASFVIKVKAEISDDMLTHNIPTPGVPGTLILLTSQPIPVKVLNLYVRKGRSPDFEFQHIVGDVAVLHYLQKT